ncbi:MAG: TonB-dependent receptor [Bryobacteraceae bacterium]|nr:TonB-dependent receptor [Bryobacteraceae bacterium]
MKSATVFLSLLICGLPAAAQYGRGVILGTVTDPSGGAVPGIRVTARNLATNETREFTTDDAGGYTFTALLAGKYEITAAGGQFKTTNVPDVELRVNSQVRVDVVMQLGALSETVVVQSTAAQLQTNTAAMGTVIDNRTMIELPLNARNFYDLVALTPGAIRVRGASSVMDERSIEIGGVRNTSTNAMLDGVDFSVANINNPAIALSLDAVQEFKVQTNFMDASYGSGAAGIDMVTRRGANAFHGVVYDYVRNRAFQAGQFFRPPRGAPRFSYNQFGAAAGGKIKKDKTFYFGDWEARRRRTGNILQGLVPTPAMREGDFTGTTKTVLDPMNQNAPFPGNRIPLTRYSRIARALLEFFPDPNLTGRPGLNYITTPPDRERRDQFTGRVDHQLSPRGALFGRYSFADNALVDSAYRVGKGVIRPDRSQNGAIGYTHTFGTNLISETRLGFTKAYLARVSDGDRFSKNYAAELGLKNLAAIPGDYTEPNISLQEYNPGAGRASSGFAGYGLRIVQNNIYYRVAETMTLIKGRHTMKFGGDANRLMVGYDQGSNQNGSFSFAANYTGDSFANYLLGIPQSASGGVGGIVDQGIDFGGVAKYSIGTRFQGFFQDDIKITDRLTLNLGLRYEVFQTWRGRLANFDIATNRQLLAGRTEYYQPGVGLVKGTSVLLPERPIRMDANNFLPRLGVAYRANAKTVVRAGIGIFSLLNTGGATLGRMTSTLPFFVFANLVGNPTTPTIFMDQAFPTARESAGTVGANNDLNRRDGYMYSYNLNIQRQVTGTLLLEVGYMGNTGHKQVGSIWVNQPRLPAFAGEPRASRLPFPNAVPTFAQTANFEWSNYNSGFVRMEQRVWRGLSVISAYTYSKTMDAVGPGQDMYNRRLERGLASNDVRHNFIAGFVDDLPVGRGRFVDITNPVANFVIGGWQLNGIINFRSGLPFTIATAGDLADVGTGGQRANATGSKPVKLDPRVSGLRGLDPAAYSLPARGTFGSAGRNTQPGFGVNQWDASLSKNFPLPMLGEAGRLQLRFEWFNLFNHTQFFNPNATFNTPVFGLVTGAADPRILQIAGRLQW